MTFEYSEELLEYMRQKKMKNIVVEVVTSDSSDFDLTELHVHLVNERLTNIFKKERHYRGVPTEHGEVLLPRYVLEYSEVIRFGLKKNWIFKSVSCEGITL